MVYMFLSALALLCLCTGFHYSYCRHGIEECYLGLYKGVVEEAVVVAGMNGSYASIPQFYLPRLRYLLGEYFEMALKPYCREYSTFARTKEDTFGDRVYGSGVIITFTAKIDYLTNITRTAHFSIRRTEL